MVGKLHSLSMTSSFDDVFEVLGNYREFESLIFFSLWIRSHAKIRRKHEIALVSEICYPTDNQILNAFRWRYIKHTGECKRELGRIGKEVFRAGGRQIARSRITLQDLLYTAKLFIEKYRFIVINEKYLFSKNLNDTRVHSAR